MQMPKVTKEEKDNDNQPFKVKIITYLKTHCQRKESCDHREDGSYAGGQSTGQDTVAGWELQTHAEPTVTGKGS